MRASAAGLALVVAATAGCDGEANLQGYYSAGFEQSIFAPCGEGRVYWAVPDSSLGTQYAALALPMYTWAYAEVVGEIDIGGDFGQFGYYDRQIRVVRTLQVRLEQAGDCPRNLIEQQE